MIPLHLVQEELLSYQDISIVMVSPQLFDSTLVYGAYPLYSVDNLRSDRLYVLKADNPILQDDDALEKMSVSDIRLMIVGDAQFDDFQVPSLIVSQNNSIRVDYIEMLNRLTLIFQKYETWRNDLYKAMYDEDLDEMLEISCPIFDASLSLVDSEYRWMGFAGPAINGFNGVNSQLPVDFISLVKSDKAGEQIHRKRSAFIVNDIFGYYGTDQLCYNLFLINEYFGRLVIMRTDSDKAFTESDEYLANELGRCLQIAIRQLYSNPVYVSKHNEHASDIYRITRKLLENEPVEQLELDYAVRSAGWATDESFFIGYLYLNQASGSPKNCLYYCRHILLQFEGVYPISKDNHITLLIRQSAYPDIKLFQSDFIIYLRENNFRLGISNTCRDLNKLYYYSRQSEIAFTIGMSRNNTDWAHHFGDYLLDYLIQPMREMPLEYLCAEELLILREYDRKNESEYYRTLLVYIENQLNAVQAAKKLYIHHGTMVFRIKRLKELIGIDFKDQEKVLHLYLSYKMMRELAQ